jgi:hypothetical protein
MASGDGYAGLVFCDQAGAPLTQPLIRHAVGAIQPGQSVAISTYVKFLRESTDCRESRLLGSLFLEGAEMDGTMRSIQTNAIEIKQGIPFHPDPDAAILLVINHTTTAVQLKAWSDMAESLNLRHAIWDIGVHHHLSMAEKLPENGGQSLNSMWRDKLVVVLSAGGGPCESLAPDAFDHIAADQLQESMSGYNIRFYVVGPNRPVALRAKISNSATVWTPIPLSSTAELRAVLSAERTADREYILAIERTGLRGSLRDPDGYLKDKLRELREFLAAQYPHERFHLVGARASTLPRKVPCLPLYKEQVGTISVRRERGPRDCVVRWAEVPMGTLKQSDFVTSDCNKILVLASMSCEQLVGLCLKALSPPSSVNSTWTTTSELLKRALTYKIAVELGISGDHREDWGVGGSGCLEYLSQELRRINQHGDLNPTNYSGLVSKLVFLRDAISPWYRTFLRSGREHLLWSELNSAVKNIETHHHKLFGERELAAYRKSFKSELAELHTGVTGGDLTGFLKYLIKTPPNAPQPTVMSHSINPYFLDESVSKQAYTEQRRRIETYRAVHSRALRELIMRPSRTPDGECQR